MKHNPLFELFRKNSDINIPITDEEFNLYLWHYYKNSDVDLINYEESIFDFIDSVYDLLNKFNNMYLEPNIVNCVRTASIIVSNEFIENELEEISKLFIDSDQHINVNFIKNNISNNIIKKYFYDKFYIQWKNEYCEQYKDKFKNNIFY